jgi:hypothetical protein
MTKLTITLSDEMTSRKAEALRQRIASEEPTWWVELVPVSDNWVGPRTFVVVAEVDEKEL